MVLGGFWFRAFSGFSAYKGLPGIDILVCFVRGLGLGPFRFTARSVWGLKNQQGRVWVGGSGSVYPGCT